MPLEPPVDPEAFGSFLVVDVRVASVSGAFLSVIIPSPVFLEETNGRDERLFKRVLLDATGDAQR
jgi:hypothetical protein